MAERKEITYFFDKVEDWQAALKPSEELIKEDTGVERWRSTRTMPPTYYPPPMTQQAIEKLKEFKGVTVKDLSEMQN
ncbi:hypothetical protein NW752_008327 [Fusarium irregulare]|nr:hypothetical protein NW752_008327 [Fusarium irregulare]